MHGTNITVEVLLWIVSKEILNYVKQTTAGRTVVTKSRKQVRFVIFATSVKIVRSAAPL